jgi:hypothetical protein
MQPGRLVQIHQYNDPELLEFFNEHRVQYRLVGDHLFIIRSRGHDVAAGPGDWLSTAADGHVDVHRGDYARRAQQAILRARRARARSTEIERPRARRDGVRSGPSAERRVYAAEPGPHPSCPTRSHSGFANLTVAGGSV